MVASTESHNTGGGQGDLSVRLAVGVADGLAEASWVLARELEGVRFGPELIGTSVTALLKANARFLGEVAVVVRQATGEYDARARARAEEAEYQRLADIVARRVRGAETPPPVAPLG